MKTILIAAVAAALCSEASAQEATKPLSAEAKVVLLKFQKSIQTQKVFSDEEGNKKRKAEMETWAKEQEAAETKRLAELDAQTKRIHADRKRLLIPSHSYIPKSEAEWIIDAIERNGCRHK